jgi:pimeloyl-ACP methyl ester carboxylesterase
MTVADGYASSTWPVATTLFVIASGGAALWLLAAWWTGKLVHRPPRLTPPRALIRLGRATPDDLSMAYEASVYQVEDAKQPGHSLELAAWTIPSAGDVMVLLLHGYGDSRSGALPWAKLWHDLGCRVVLVDLRAHGESGGKTSDGGVAETEDVSHLIDQLRHERPVDRLILAGVSFGAMVAASVAARRDDVTGLVLDSPIDNWFDATRRWGDLYSLPPSGAAAHRLRTRWSCPSALLPAATHTARDLAAADVPTLLVLPTRDVLLPEDRAEQIASASKKAQVWRPDARHNEAIAVLPGEYREQAKQWLHQLG